MKVSIVVPIYNVEKYLKRCVDSILNQSYIDIEVILINDGSVDNCGKICDDYSVKDNRIVVIHQLNKGLPAARNAGLKLTKGDYVSFIDSDDCIDSNMIEEFVAIAKANNLPDIITSNIFQYSLDNTKYTHVRNDTFIYNRILHKDEIKKNYIKPFYGGILGNIPSVCNKFYKTSFIQSNNICFDESLVRAEDYWFNLDAFQKAKTLFSIDKAYYHYYVTPFSVIRKYRENDFDFFLNTRHRLLKENNHLNIEIDWNGLNSFFINNTNEFILLIVKNEKLINGFIKIKNIFINKEFIKILEGTKMINLHTKLIKYFIKNHLYILAYSVYYMWSLKAKLKNKC